jgi:release factor glutamine methyltransferase
VHESATKSAGNCIAHATRVLEDAGCEAARQDAEEIIADTLGVPVAEFDDDAPVPETTAAEIAARIERRRQHEPLEYILGRCFYRGLELLVDHRALIPWENNGPMVEAAKRLSAGSRIHDVGTGSGAIALAIKNERPDLIVSGSDVSPAAVAVATANARHLNLDVHFTVADGLPAGAYDFVIANLPYQDDAKQTLALPPETHDHQPHVAVFAGPDGLEAIRAFMAKAPRDVRIMLQHAPGRAEAVQSLFTDPVTIEGTDGIASWTEGFARDNT